MNNKAKMMTLGATCVVDNIVVTHFRNPIVGMASGDSGCVKGDDASRILCSVAELSNQKRHVISQSQQMYGNPWDQ